MDVVFVIDNTGSMGNVIQEIQAQVGQIADAVAQASGSDYQFGLIVLPRNDIEILLTLEPGNRAQLDTAVARMSTEGSCGLGVGWDEGLNTAVNGLSARTGSDGSQIGDFPNAWRAGATKIAIIITDTHPSGFDCDFQAGTHDVLVHQVGEQAAGAGILVTSVYVPTGNSPESEIIALLQDPVTSTGGFFKETQPDASDVSDIIIEIVENCGGGARLGPTNLFIDPMELVLLNGETGLVRILNMEPAGFGNQTVWSVENVDGTPGSFSVAFHPRAAELEGTEEIDLLITAGSETAQGTHLVIVKAAREGALDNYAIIHVIVECRPPFFLGLPGHQPQSQTVPLGTTAVLRAVPGGDGPLRYQWYRGPSGSTAFPIAGATTSELTTEAITVPTPYWVRVSNACGSRNSAAAIVSPSN
ncbi:MAG TPA: vWA domain-containing protein [Thermoanaerobaculia bacterium]|nr:vWA domain-containing protein [Thermoanaerobaculia bacterium]